MYVKLKNGKPNETLSRPNWFHEDGSPVTDNALFKEDAIYPVIDTPPTFNEYTQTSTQKPLPDWTVNTDNVEIAYEITDMTIEESKQKVRLVINQIRYIKIYNENIPYIFPGDTVPDGIQMRDEVDRQNIQDILLDATNKPAEAIMYFMPVSNTLKTMTAQELITMGLSIKARGDSIVSYAWGLKSQIDNAETLEQIETITATLEIGWPE